MYTFNLFVWHPNECNPKEILEIVQNGVGDSETEPNKKLEPEPVVNANVHTTGTLLKHHMIHVHVASRVKIYQTKNNHA